MTNSIFRHLDKSMHRHLTDLTKQASSVDESAAADLARQQLPKVVSALRALLDEHHPDEQGRCSNCRRRWTGRRTATPCRAYLTAHLALVIADDSPRRMRHAG
jgi:hypothetical protein